MNVTRKQVEGGKDSSPSKHAVLGVKQVSNSSVACSLVCDKTLSKGFVMRKCVTFSSHIYDLL